ncbi:hypothetical protein BD324DRAFT_624319 [Kockovaella imperatae]|uniref:Uncharacterized protein n=1 Tax=Kockovaella imperatae TaxID=4999 RepID=A0A1Y1UJ10_9TREE|nr:hypothetical protein BD324DRAFT_624319 [Kockovaella imperatae]ORX38053.1 hypothetical protein BD324DRAFT_624319 [Kockovaella imperatae]
MNAVASSSTTRELYRSLLREVRLAAKKPRRQRGSGTEKQFRTMISASSLEGQTGKVDKMLIEARDYLRSSRIHAELLKRYNPTLGMTDAEKVHAAARRVGLDTPIKYKPE